MYPGELARGAMGDPDAAVVSLPDVSHVSPCEHERRRYFSGINGLNIEATNDDQAKQAVQELMAAGRYPVGTSPDTLVLVEGFDTPLRLIANVADIYEPEPPAPPLTEWQ